MQSWLDRYGLCYVEVTLAENVPWNALPLPLLCIMLGQTANGTNHAVVGRAEKDKFIPIFNPLPKGGMITTLASLGFIMPRDPVSYVRMGMKLDAIEHLSRDAGITLGPIVKLAEVNALALEGLQKTPEGYKLPINGRETKAS